MSRRQKLTKQERARRQQKRERRAELRNEQIVRYREALRAYIRAVTHHGKNYPRCICDKCGLEQEYLLGEIGFTGVVTVAVCEGWEGMGCGSEFCSAPDE